MPLQTQQLDILFTGGVDQKTDPRFVQPGSLASATNVAYVKNGALRKRPGSNTTPKQSLTAAGNSVLLSSANCVEEYRGGPVVSDGTSLYSFDSIKNALIWQDNLPECTALRTSVSQSTNGILACDTAVTNGYACHVYRANDVTGTATNYATLINLSDGSEVSTDFVLQQSTKSGLRVIGVSGKFYAIWTDSSNHIVYSQFDTAGAFTWSVALTIVNDMSATSVQGAWDVSVIDGSINWVVGYQQTGAPDQLELRIFNSSGSNIASAGFAIGGGSLPIKAIGLKFTSAETGWVSYVTSDGATQDFVRCKGVNPSTLAGTVADSLLWSELSGASTTRRCSAARVSSTIVAVASGCATSSNGLLDISWRQFNTSAATVGPQRTHAGYMMWSKLAAIGSEVYAVVWYHNDSTNASFHLIALNVADTSADNARARPVCTIGARIAGNVGGLVSTPSIATIGNSQYLTPITIQQTTTKASAWQVTLDFITPQRHQAVQIGDTLYLAGGVPSVFDGGNAVEHGFLAPPVIASTSVGAGGSVDVGTHGYAAIWKYFNRRGELVRSAPAFTSVVTTGGNQTVTLNVKPLTLTTKQDANNNWSPAPTLSVYRTTLLDGLTYWQLVADSSETANDPRSSSNIVITDTLPDGTITSNAFSTLYSAGGVLVDQCPPSLTCLCFHKGRLWGVGDDGLTLWATKQFVTGFQPAFNDQLTLIVPEAGGVVTGLCSLDDALIVFKRDRIYKLFGTGWDVTGNNSDFSDFIRVASDTGCIQSRSIVVGPQGAFFLSAQGLYLLSRAGEVVYIGKPLEDSVAANQTCFAADIVPARGEVRLCLAPNAFSATGILAQYDYVQNAFSVGSVYDVDTATAGAVLRGGKCCGGVWYWLGAGGQLNAESSTSFLDGGTQYINRVIETPWVKLGGLTGWGRAKSVRPLFEQATPCQLKIEVAFDYSPNYIEVGQWTDAQIAAWTAGGLSQAKLALGFQRCESIRFRVTDLAPATLATGTGEGARLLGLQLEYGAKPGGFRTPPAQRAG